jgi:hypothetical protein
VESLHTVFTLAYKRPVVDGLKINPQKSHGLKTRVITVITGRKARIVEAKKIRKEPISVRTPRKTPYIPSYKQTKHYEKNHNKTTHPPS